MLIIDICKFDLIRNSAVILETLSFSHSIEISRDNDTVAILNHAPIHENLARESCTRILIVHRIVHEIAARSYVKDIGGRASYVFKIFFEIMSCEKQQLYIAAGK